MRRSAPCDEDSGDAGDGNRRRRRQVASHCVSHCASYNGSDCVYMPIRLRPAQQAGVHAASQGQCYRCMVPALKKAKAPAAAAAAGNPVCACAPGGLRRRRPATLGVSLLQVFGWVEISHVGEASGGRSSVQRHAGRLAVPGGRRAAAAAAARGVFAAGELGRCVACVWPAGLGACVSRRPRWAATACCLSGLASRSRRGGTSRMLPPWLGRHAAGERNRCRAEAAASVAESCSARKFLG